MLIKGSCHCGAVKFSVEAYAPVPFLRCYCSICRKTAGGGGYAINLGARFDTMKVTGEKNIAKFQARIDGKKGHAERRFCKKCGSALWVWDKQWPELVHPFASAIDSDLPEPPSQLESSGCRGLMSQSFSGVVPIPPGSRLPANWKPP